MMPPLLSQEKEAYLCGACGKTIGYRFAFPGPETFLFRSEKHRHPVCIDCADCSCTALDEEQRDPRRRPCFVHDCDPPGPWLERHAEEMEYRDTLRLLDRASQREWWPHIHEGNTSPQEYMCEPPRAPPPDMPMGSAVMMDSQGHLLPAHPDAAPIGVVAREEPGDRERGILRLDVTLHPRRRKARGW